MTTVSDAFAVAMDHHKAGRLAEAEEIYHQILAVEPGHADSLHLLGVVASQTGRYAIANEMINKAIALDGAVASYHSNLGNAFREQGQLTEAVACFERALTLDPNLAEAYYNLGEAMRDLGKLDRAVACYERALAVTPDLVEAHDKLGNTLRELGKLEDAVAHSRRALRLRPDLPAVHLNLGIALNRLGKLDQAVRYFAQAVAVQPGFAELHYNLGTALKDQGWFEQALASFEQALVLRPNFPEAHNNLCIVLREMGRLEEAVERYEQALALNQNFAEAHNNLGTAVKELGRVEDAVARYERAVALKPDYALAHSNLGIALLLQGDLERGFREYEWRWKIQEWWSNFTELEGPVWRGGDISAATIVLQTEQGAGDTIQFIRYARLMRQRAAAVIVSCPSSLRRLCESVPGVSQVIPHGDPLPPSDCRVPLLSVPHFLGTTLKTIPAEVPYLFPTPDQVKRFAPLLEWAAPRKIGLAWRGDPTHVEDRFRSISADVMAVLGDVPGITWVILQVDMTAKEAVTLGRRADIRNCGPLLGDFADAAAVISTLDLVITVDTVIAHLAGALGRPTWVLLPFVPDWRWLRERSDSPWYPTLRLFRQSRAGDWAGVMARVGAALVEDTRASGPRAPHS